MSIWYRRIACLIVIYALQRFLFVSFNSEALRGVSTWGWLFAVADGTRFDLCAIATLNAPLILLHYMCLVIVKWRAVRDQKYLTKAANWVVFILFLAVNIPAILFGIIDSRLFSFTGRRMNWNFFEIMGDVREQAWGILTQYWTLSLLGFLVSVTFIALTKDRHHGINPIRSIRHETARVIIWILLAGILIRGGFQTKPLSPAHAYSYQPAALANTVLNSSITILRTPYGKAPARMNYFDSMDVVRANLSFERSSAPTTPGYNVVILIVESLATEYMGHFNNGQGYTPFLDALARRAITFDQSFANGRRTIDAVPAIFAGIPAWREQPFITSPYGTNAIKSLPAELKKIGYSSAFFHGASTGSMHFDVFTKLAGFDSYYGREDFPDKSEDDGQWGIFDEPFLQYAATKMSEMPKPFISGIFTLSSHNPFRIPAEYAGKFPRGTLPIHASIGYADYSLSAFFGRIQKESWYENTIFVITGDHTSLSEKPFYNNYLGRFRVPIIIFDPKNSLPKSVEKKIASHIDIVPTIFGLLGVNYSNDWLLGGSLFDKNWDGCFVQNEYDTWMYLDHERQVILQNGTTPKYYANSDVNWQNQLGGTPNDDLRLTKLKSFMQYFLNGLLDNSWLYTNHPGSKQ